MSTSNFRNKKNKCSNTNGILNNSEKMLRKKGFIHHFIGEGLEEGNFINALENIKDLNNEYEEINNDNYNNNKKKEFIYNETEK